MSVWPNALSTGPSLVGSEGALVSVSINVDPRFLESLLEALAQIEYPVNPQIYHDAAITYFYDDGRQSIEPTTIIEFPAYAGWLPVVRKALQSYGFNPDNMTAIDMLSALHSDDRLETAPAGSPYRARRRSRHAGLARTGTLQ